MKIAVFVRPNNYGGTALYRQYLPHEMMSKMGYNIIFTDKLDPSEYTDVDIFMASKSYFEHANHLVHKLKKMGIVTIVDFDDFWTLPQSHLLYGSYRKNNTVKILTDALRLFDYVSCTTPLLQNEIRKINPRVEVFENAIDPNLDQFEIIDTRQDDRVRFGWIGGHCHGADIALLDGTPQKLSGEFSISLFGYDRQKNSVYNGFADILSGRRKLINQLPPKFFLYDQAKAREYTQFYNYIDVALAPLVNDTFNSMKSELKMVEAGFMKKAAIASDVYPYRYIINSRNCLTATHKQHWAKRMQRLINNPSLMEDLGLELHESVKDKYHLKTVTTRRAEWYKTLRPL